MPSPRRGAGVVIGSGAALRLGLEPILTGELLMSVGALIPALRLRNRTLGLV
jgi:hypothetical protein